MPRRFKPIIAQLPEPEQLDVQMLADSWKNQGFELFCVLGPTASGKTRYAVALSHKLRDLTGCGVEILSADSRQVYTGMDIGTGKDLSEYGDIPYHLIDILPAGASYNVYRFQQDFQLAYDGIRSRGAIPILCGGTGLYINAVTLPDYNFGAAAGESASPDVVIPSDAVARPEGRGGRNTFYIGTLVSREERNARIDARLDARLKEGLVEEVSGLLDSGIPAQTLISYGLEYKYVTQYVTGQLQYGQMRTLLATAIHQFAKRQMTWFRGMERAGVRIHWVVPEV